MEFWASLEVEMKRLQGQRIGTRKKQAQILTEKDEELLWTKGLLGDSISQSLLDTLIFYNGLFFCPQEQEVA